MTTDELSTMAIESPNFRRLKGMLAVRSDGTRYRVKADDDGTGVWPGERIELADPPTAKALERLVIEHLRGLCREEGGVDAQVEMVLAPGGCRVVVRPVVQLGRNPGTGLMPRLPPMPCEPVAVAEGADTLHALVAALGAG